MESARRGYVCGEDVSDSLLSGDIAYFRLPEVMHMVALARLTGLLKMRATTAEVSIYFRDGEVAFATGDTRGEGEQLGQLLVRMGRITQAELSDALDRAETSGGRLGTALVEAGHAEPGSITSALSKQTERSVYKAMGWSEGRFEFGMCDMPAFVEEFPLGLRIEGLILEGMRRTEQMKRVAELIPSLDIVFSRPVVDREMLAGLGLSEFEQKVARVVDGRREVEEVIRLSGLNEFVVLKSLNALFTAGIIKKLKKTTIDDRTGYV